jgi:TRAP transporter 4TM/12TM fusion protein
VSEPQSADVSEDKYRQFRGPLRILVKVIAAGVCLYCLLMASGHLAYLGISYIPLQLNAIFLGGVLITIFLLIPPTKRSRKDQLPWYDISLAVAALAGNTYIAVNAIDLMGVLHLSATPLEVGLGLVTFMLILEAVRRVLSWPMVAMGLFFFIYLKFGSFLPGMWRAYPLPWPLAMSNIYTSTQGIYGPILRIGSGIAIVFLTFGVVFTYVGGGDYLIRMAMAITGSLRGGPAKTATIASAMFGTLSGSAVANVVVTGSVTIPMMKRIGYGPAFAGAVEAVASSGGTITPPVMGTIAFLMSAMLNVPYADIAIAAALPALLYYFGIFMQIDLRAARLGLRGLPRHELPSVREEFKKGWEFTVPLLALVVSIFLLNWDVNRCGLFTIVVTLIVSVFRKQTRSKLGFMKLVNVLEEAFRGVLTVGAVMAQAGVILAALVVTGLGPRISAALINLAGGNLFILVLLTAVVCYLMGMGVDILGAYIILAALVGPSMEYLGVRLFVSHFFILYMCAIGFFTPPLAPAAFVAGAIAKADPFRVGFIAMRLGIIVFLVPFIIVYAPALLLIGSFREVIQAVVTSLGGVFILAVGIEGYLFRNVSWVGRILLIGAGLLMIVPEPMTDAIGAAMGFVILLFHWRSSKASNAVKAA